MMRCWLFPVALVCCLLPHPAAARIRAVFVGVDHYRFSRTHVPDNDFDDLDGAVSDVARIKTALAASYGIEIDKPKDKTCPKAPAPSVTLTNGCATSAAIFAALDSQIAALAKGDTLLFYFAGHGALVEDDQIHDQPSGQNDSILPVDARDPDAAAPADILDREIRGVINRAVARGVNVVTIFDSCHSATGSRGFVLGKARSAPALHVPTNGGDVAMVDGPGYWVHLGASTDAEEAREGVIDGGQTGGLFTYALATTLAALKHPAATSFGDIMDDVTLKVLASGAKDQHPQIEGAVNATLGGPANRVPLLAATVNGRVATLSAGRLSGVTPGSTFALFVDRSSAVAAGAKPVATGRVTAVTPFAATLALDRPASAGSFQALEQSHAYGERKLRVDAGQDDDLRRALGDALADAPYAEVGDPAQVIAYRYGRLLGQVLLTSRDGSAIADLPSIEAPGFADGLRAALQREARVQALLALNTGAPSDVLTLCLNNGESEGTPCTSDPTLAAGKPIHITLINGRDQDRYLYLIGIDQKGNPVQLLPVPGGRDAPVPAKQPLVQSRPITPTVPGFYQFIALSTTASIDPGILVADGGARGGPSCATPLGQLICEAATGSRDPATAAVGDWDGVVQSRQVVAMKEGR